MGVKGCSLSILWVSEASFTLLCFLATMVGLGHTHIPVQAMSQSWTLIGSTGKEVLSCYY